MKIKKISIINIRNIIKSEIEFNKNINVIIGNNAQGKTNFIESLYIVGNLKSFRTNDEKEIININENNACISSKITNNGLENDVKINFFKNENKIIRLNSKKVLKISDYIGKLNITLFSPDDLLIVKGDSSIRRRYIDNILSKIDKEYLINLINYHKILKQRNILLKKIKLNIEKENSLYPWNEQLITFSHKIYKKRTENILIINLLSHNIHKKLKNTEDLEINYKDTIYSTPSGIDDDYEKAFKIRLKRVQPEEIARGISIIGCHRDDIEIKLNNLNSRVFGSQGQKRSIAISLRVAEAEFINDVTKEYPVFLLDDIFSELDEKRKEDLLSLIHFKPQVFITGTNREDFEQLLIKSDVFNVNNGEINKNHV